MTTSSKFIVTLEVAYQHVIKVGVVADNELVALRLAESAFGSGSLWTGDCALQLLHDDFHEEGERVDRYVSPLGNAAFPPPDSTVHELELQSNARRLLSFCRMVSDAAPSLTEQIDLDRLFDVKLSARSIQQLRELLPHLAEVELAL
ncbi:patatin [Achromobacter seleniivolatilans]|uniref:Patatin n=1 Tax=Achromobacter seleniivolatilans TaxID=3047478 RepID=A0ABY9M0E1_9BURK|nr:patatin [Achromobacter sp. R39]WMD19663.1 patatin [Achromobacter sp. R39]